MMNTYNHERFISRSFESVLAQKVNFDYEILVERLFNRRHPGHFGDLHCHFPGRTVPLLRDHNLSVT